MENVRGNSHNISTELRMSPIHVPQPLTSFPTGVLVHLAFFALADPEAQRLRELGVIEGNQIHILKNGDSFVCCVESSRIALRREVAMNVFGTPVAP